MNQPEDSRSPASPAPAGSGNVSVTLDADNRIVVQIGEECRIGDSYYLSIDPQEPEHDPSPTAGLRTLLLSWIRELSSSDGDLIYLPFDFSDEYTRWLACQKIADQVLVVCGWAQVEGWAIRPANFREYVHAVPNFRPDEPLLVQQFYLPRFLSQLRRSAARCRLPDQPQPAT